MAYATVDDVQARMTDTMTDKQIEIATALLDDAAVIIDAYNADASTDTKKIVSARIVARAIKSTVTSDIPIGATTGSMSALGYSQSWTIGSGGSVGELYLTKVEKLMLGVGDKIGSRSVLETIPDDE